MTVTTVLGSFLVCALLVPVGSAVCRRLGAVDEPGHRKIHAEPTPKSGGLTIAVTLLLLLPVCLSTFSISALAVIGAALLLFLLGFFNDFREIGPRARYLCEIAIIITLASVVGFKIHTVGDLIGVGPIHLGYWTYPLTAFAVASLVNGFNMLDGADGLLGLTTLPMLIALMVLAEQSGIGDIAGVLAALAGALGGFVVHNMRLLGRFSSKAFLGDSGSLLLGAVVTYAFLAFSQFDQPLIRPIDAVWIAGLPIMETVRVVIARWKRDVSIFTPGKDHVHHFLLGNGWTHRQVSVLLGFFSAGLASVGLMGAQMQWSEPVLCWVFVLSFVLYRRLLEIVDTRLVRLNKNTERPEAVRE